MKTISRYILTLALLITAVGGAWAAETVETTLWEGTCTEDGVEINSTTVSEFNVGDVLRVYVTIPEGGANFKIVYKGESNFWEETTIPSVGNQWPWLNGGDTYMDVTFTEADITALTGMGIYIYKGEQSTITKVTLITPAASEPTIDVTTNAASEQDLFTEASFNMSASDVTVNYTLVRDMSIQMTATMGDGTDGLRYRVKKAQQGEGYEPADMNMMQVLALVAVYDGIEQKDLTLDEDYYCRIYKLDEQTLQPEGDGVELFEFDFAPGLYALKAFAKDDSDYDGETALSNTFKLFQGYEVEIAAQSFATYYRDEALTLEESFAETAGLYTVSEVTATEAVLSEKIDVMPKRTPMLIYNESETAQQILLIPTADVAPLTDVAAEFKGTAVEKTVSAEEVAATNFYVLTDQNQFVWVKDAGTIAANKCWLEIAPSEAAGARRIVFSGSGTTGISTTDYTDYTDGTFYDLNGRKFIKKPTKKGIYIQNGKKVVIK